jgi:hypothetical protein
MTIITCTAGSFPRSETLPGGLSSFSRDITVNEDFTIFSFISEELPRRISLITSGSQSMTWLGAAQLCQSRIEGGRLFTWDSRRQLEELSQAVYAVAFRYLTDMESIRDAVMLNLYQPPGQDTEMKWRDRKWYRLPADVSSMSLMDIMNSSSSIENQVPSSFLDEDVPFHSYGPDNINDESGSCAYLFVKSNIRRAAWLDDSQCSDEHMWAACESSG